MIRRIHLTHRFEKQLEAMRRSHKLAVAASRKADAVIEKLVENGQSPLQDAGKFTRHRDCRIQNAVKFDIGKGYRILGVKKDDCFYFLFVGPHDDCAAWVENNRGLKNPNGLKRIRTLKTDLAKKQNLKTHAPETEPDYDDLLFSRITEQDLRFVFKGLRSGIRKG